MTQTDAWRIVRRRPRYRVRLVQHEDGSLKGEHAALLDIAQTGQLVAVGADEVHGNGLDPLIGSSSHTGADTRIHRSERGARGLSTAISLRRPVMTYCISTVLVV
jgi:hypothetical protein